VRVTMKGVHESFPSGDFPIRYISQQPSATLRMFRFPPDVKIRTD